MGTNYYGVGKPCANACEHCSAPRRVHICKSLTSFRGYVADPFDDDAYSPVLTWPQWRAALRQQAAEVVDEYGVSQTVADFIARVERTSTEGRGRQMGWYRDHLECADDVWQDACGFTFSLREFS